MNKLDTLFSEYAGHHQTKGNIATHFVGIPMIMYGLFILLSLIPVFGFVTGAELFIVAGLAFYFSMDWKVGTGMTVVAGLIDLGARLTPFWWIGLAAFIVGWAIQFYGHIVYEKKSPSFLENLTHLLVGPAFILNEVIPMRRVNREETA